MDPAKLLEFENAALRIVARHESILDPRALPELLDLLRTVVEVAVGGITLPDGRDSFRTLVVSRGAEHAVPYGVKIPTAPETYDVVIEEGRAFLADDLSRGVASDRLAELVGVRSYAVYPVRKSRDERPFAGFVLGFDREGGPSSLPVELGEVIAMAIAPSVARGLEASRGRRAIRIIEASGDAMLAWDVHGKIIDANPAASRLCGAPRDELLGADVAAFLGGVPEGPGSAVRMALTRRDGSEVVVSVTVSVVDSDPLVAAHALLRDLTREVIAEREAALRLAQLRDLTEQHTLLLDNAPLVIFRIDPESERLLYLSRHAERLFGVTAAEALATPGFLRRLHVDAEGCSAFEDALRAAKRGLVSSPYEARLERPPHDGLETPADAHVEAPEAVYARGSIYPILASDGRVTAVEGILLDVSGERAARSRLLQADRLATVGMLAAGVAHEINNPAAFMLLGLDALGRQLAGADLDPATESIVGQLVTDLRETGKRIVDIAKDMRLFASPPKDAIGGGVVDVGRAVESALTITRAQIVERADVELDLADDLPPVAIDEGRLGQVLVNLLVNAAQAVAEARKARPMEGRTDVVRVSTRLDGDSVVIAVEDTGVGLSEKVAARLFTPFFTTKGPDAGTGLGLAISKAILARAGGTISARSPGTLGTPPRGARFEIRLPAFLEEVVRANPSPLADAPPRRGRVLIVEDEALLGRALAEHVAAEHEVELAQNGEQALELLAQRPFDVVLCDLKMPGMSGEDLLERVKIDRPEQARRFVFMTGIGFGSDVERLVSEHGVKVLEKPFPMDVGLRAIASAMADRGPTDPHPGDVAAPPGEPSVTRSA